MHAKYVDLFDLIAIKLKKYVDLFYLFRIFWYKSLKSAYLEIILPNYLKSCNQLADIVKCYNIWCHEIRSYFTISVLIRGPWNKVMFHHRFKSSDLICGKRKLLGAGRGGQLNSNSLRSLLISWSLQILRRENHMSIVIWKEEGSLTLTQRKKTQQLQKIKEAEEEERRE